ncbi:MAG: hypothetical protein E7055_02115 [Lentisphaerae bacterium]|nr:hypothetical protein [Lentisphaerota bacterium]
MKTISSIVLLAGLALFLDGQEPNLIKNPGFTAGTNWWYNSPIFSIAKENNNRYFRMVSATEVKPVFAEQTPPIPVEAGKSYEFSCRFKSMLKSGEVYFMFLVRDAGNRCIRILNSPKITEKTGSEWENLRYVFVVPEKGTVIQIRIYAGMSFSGEVQLDDLVLKEGNGELKLPELPKKPKLTGKPDAGFLASALQLTDFRAFPGNGDGKAIQKTELYLAGAEDQLCGFFKLFHGKDKAFIKKKSPRDNESLLWKNEVLELFFTHINSDAPLYQIAFDPHGQIYDAQGENLNWDSHIRIKSGEPGPEYTWVQFELPLSDLGYHYENRGAGIRFSLNVARNHSTVGAAEFPISVWTPVQHLREAKNYHVFSVQKNAPPERISARLCGSSLIQLSKDPARWWKVKDPLFKELISDRPAPFPGLRMFSWNMPIAPHRNRAYALQYGRTFDRQERFAEYDRSGIRHLEMYHRTPDKELLPWMDGKPGRSVMLLYYTGRNGFDPYWMFEGLADETAEELKKNPARYSGVAMPDEYLHGLDSILAATAANPKTAASVEAIRREIREKYGYGKYDIPSSPETDTEPFARLAMRKYLLAKMVLAQKKMMEVCREHQKKTGYTVQVISSDPTSQMRIQHQSRIAPYVDMVNVQSGPANSDSRQRSGFGAKLVTDLSGKPAFCYVHLENLNNVSYDAEASASLLSEAFRAGAIGVALYPVDWAGVTRRQGSSNNDAYGHRPRWDTILDTAKIINSMNLLKIPEPDYAVFVSNDSALSRRRWEAPPYEAYYNLAGPGARTWFRFISDIQLIDGKEKLSNWKFVVIPKADIVDEALYPHFEKYVKNGGTLVCFDPDFSRFRPDGTDGRAFTEKLFGVRTANTKYYDRIVPSTQDGLMKGMKPAIPLAAGNLKLEGKSVKVLAASPAGDAVITEKDYPRGGRAVMIAREPSYTDGSRPQWQEFNKTLLVNLGARTGQDIWRFTFPHKKEVKPVVKGTCLTGNHFLWWRDKAEKVANAPIAKDARYTLTLAPDALKAGDKLVFDFKNGNLTNREKAFSAGDLFNELKNRFIIREGKIRLDMFADTFSRGDAFQIRIDFGKKVPARRVKIFWSGTLPEVSVTAPDGRKAVIPGGKTPDVRMSETALPAGAPVSSLVLSLGARPEGEKLILSEIEVWD